MMRIILILSSKNRLTNSQYIYTYNVIKYTPFIDQLSRSHLLIQQNLLYNKLSAKTHFTHSTKRIGVKNFYNIILFNFGHYIII